MTKQSAPVREGNPERRSRASDLLVRYPDLSEEELGELRNFFNSSPAIDTALLSCDPDLIPKITLFETEQKDTLAHEAKLGVLVAALALFVIAIVYAFAAGVIQ